MIYKDCAFYEKNVTCQIVVENPTHKEKLGKIIPVPYRGYEVANLQNVYLNLSSHALVRLTCKHDEFLSYNCHEHPTDSTPCLNALTRNKFEQILNECSFQPSTLETPVLTSNGLLVPYSENISAFIEKNSSESKNLTEWDIFQNTRAPVLINSMYNMSILDNSFTYVYKNFSIASKIIFTAYTAEELDSMVDYIETIFPLTYENILIMTQFGTAILVVLFASFCCFYCFKLRSKTKLLSYFNKKNTASIYKSKRLRKFASQNDKQKKNPTELTTLTSVYKN